VCHIDNNTRFICDVTVGLAAVRVTLNVTEMLMSVKFTSRANQCTKFDLSTLNRSRYILEGLKFLKWVT